MAVVILFNAGGYDLFFQYLIYRSDSKIFDKINHSHYLASDLVEIKVPVDLPAQAPQEYSDGYQVISGQIQFKNDKYDYAEIKITHDTLYLRVIPNHDRNKLSKASDLYAKQMNDIPGNTNNKKSNDWARKSLGEKEFFTFSYLNTPQLNIIKQYPCFPVAAILNPSLEVGGKPPEA